MVLHRVSVLPLHSKMIQGMAGRAIPRADPDALVVGTKVPDTAKDSLLFYSSNIVYARARRYNTRMCVNVVERCACASGHDNSRARRLDLAFEWQVDNPYGTLLEHAAQTVHSRKLDDVASPQGYSLWRCTFVALRWLAAVCFSPVHTTCLLLLMRRPDLSCGLRSFVPLARLCR